MSNITYGTKPVTLSPHNAKFLDQSVRVRLFGFISLMKDHVKIKTKALSLRLSLDLESLITKVSRTNIYVFRYVIKSNALNPT